MQLSWGTDYQEFADTRQLPPEYGEFEKSLLKLPLETVSDMDTEELLNNMERLSKLMIYYVSTENMGRLEPVMRRQESLLKVCRDKRVSSVGYLYLEMMFERINGQLYQNYHKNRQAAECYQQLMEKTNQCFQSLKTDVSLSMDQKVYVGWYCAEGYRAAAASARMILNNKMAFDVYKRVLPILVWLESYMTEFPGICNRVADLYALIASEFYINQRGQEGAAFYEKAINILEDIWLRSNNSFYRAKMIWYHSAYGLAEFCNFSKMGKMLEAEEHVKQFLNSGNPQGWEKGILEGALGMIILQQSMVLQQQNQVSASIQHLIQSSNYLNEALCLLETACQNGIGYEVSIIKDMALKIYSSSMSSQYLLGIQYYLCGEIRQASNVFIKVLTSLTNEKRYFLSAVEAMMLRADINQYLAMIAADNNDKAKAEFYCTQAADLSMELAQKMGYDFAWGIHVSSCTMTAEVCLSTGNRNKASDYADKGIAACEILRQIDPIHPKLAMQKKLLKLKKKAFRKLF